MNANEELAYKQGVQDRGEGRGRSECPYIYARRNALLWLRGWDDQDKIIRSRESEHQVDLISIVGDALYAGPMS